MPALFVVGSSNTDLVIRIPKLPRPGETVSGGSFARFQGGKGANQAVAAARLAPPEISVRFTAAVGEGELGNAALEALAAEGLDVSCTQRLPGVPTGVAFILVDENGENSIAVAPGANHELTPEHVRAGLAAASQDDLLLLSMELSQACVAAALECAGTIGMRAILNPAPIPRSGFDRDLLKNVSVLTPNGIELAQICGSEPIEQWPPDRATFQPFFDAHPELSVVMTGGANGVCAHLGAEEPGERSLLVAPPPSEHPARDTVGAGDCFAGALAIALLEQRPWPEALSFAVRAAAISVTRDGAQASMPHRNEALASFDASP